MPVTDYWLNPYDPSAPAVTVLGYNEGLEEFPHDIYSFFISTIRDLDIASVRLLWRWLQGMQQQWESTYGKILSLPLLYSPEFCPEEFLDYLAGNIGITSPDMDYLWGELTTNEKRRLLGILVRAYQLRCTDDGIVTLFEAMTGRYVDIREYFDFRWLISGDNEYQMETALGYEDDWSLAGDPWLISEISMPVGVVPNSMAYTDFGSGNGQYRFRIDTLMDAIEDPPIPPLPRLVRINYRPTSESCLGVAYWDGTYWFVYAPFNERFGQVAIPYSLHLTDYRVSFENDAFIFDIRIMDDGTINRDLAKALARFSRPISERIYIRYYWLIDHFEGDALDNFTTSGTVTHDTDDDIVTMGSATAESSILSEVLDDDDWTNYSVLARARMGVASQTMYIRLFRQDSQNYIEIRLIPNAAGGAIPGTWAVYRVVSGTPTLIDNGNVGQFDLNVYYAFRVVAFTSGSNIILRAYQDENLLGDMSFANPWTSAEGKVQVAVSATGSMVLKDVEVHPYPMDSDYVGP